MTTKEKVETPKTENKLPELQTGMTVRVHQKIKETGMTGKEKERVQFFEGIILAYKKGRKPSPTITVRKISNGVGVEKIFPINAPTIVKIEPLKIAKVRKSKAYYLRSHKKRLREKKVAADK